MIENIGESRFYRLLPDGDTWTSQPMVLPPDGWGPRTQRLKNKKVQAWGNYTEGFEVVEEVTGRRVKTKYAPRLNAEAVYREWPNGVKERLVDIQLLEPPADDFVPPPSARITALAEPGGIIAVKSRKGHEMGGGPQPISAGRNGAVR